MNTGQFLSMSILDVIGRGKNGDLYGVELELEGRGVKMDGVAAKGWRRTEDGSLRGESVEYVFAAPCGIKEAKERVDNLFSKFKENRVDIKNSYRTSTHVHINFGDKSIKKMLNFFVLFTMLEDILEQYSGEDRVGNLFCLSSRRGEAVINILADCVMKQHDFRAFADDRYKYAACNLSTLYKFGTLEIRTMRGATNAKQVNDWLEILDQLFVRAMKAKSPIEFIENISFLGPDGFLNDVFTAPYKAELVKGLPVGFDFRGSLLNGARLCQMFAYDLQDDYDAAPVIKAKEMNAHVGQHNPARVKMGAAHAGCVIWHPFHNTRWTCSTVGGGDIFFHGDELIDDADITYDETVGRFRWKNGKYLWYTRHPHFGDETAMKRREGPYCNINRIVEDVIVDDDDDDEDNF